MSRITRFAPLAAVVAAALAPAAGAAVMPGGYVHSPGANGAAYVKALTGSRGLGTHRSSPSVLVTENSASQNRIPAANGGRQFRTLYRATK